MSRIGKLPVEIPNGVTVSLEGDSLKVKGAKGELSYQLRPEIKVEIKDNKILVSVKIETKDSSAFWGLTRALIANMVEGVTNGYEKKLQLVGVGYRARQSGTGITFAIGYSHPVEFQAPEGISLRVEDDTSITVTGVNKGLVGQVAADIRKIRKPEPYKGKGIRYENEYVRRKAGKSGKV